MYFNEIVVKLYSAREVLFKNEEKWTKGLNGLPKLKIKKNAKTSY